MAYSESHIKVRYAETDQMGVVYHANYLVWFEVGRVDFCRRQGISYRDLERDQGLFMAVSDARCRFLVPALYDDDVVIRTRLSRLRSRSLTFTYEVFREGDGTVLAEGETVHVFVDRNRRPRTLPSHVALSLRG